MVTDGRVKELRRLLGMGRTLIDSARMAEMSEKTAQKYRDDDGLPSQNKTARTYRTRTDPFEEVWGEVQERLETEPRLKARTLFEWLQMTHEGRFPDSTRRTFERRVNRWRSLHGPGKTVFFSQEHHPGRHCRFHSSCRSERHLGAEAPNKPALLAGATGGQRLHRLQRAGCEDCRTEI